MPRPKMSKKARIYAALKRCKPGEAPNYKAIAKRVDTSVEHVRWIATHARMEGAIPVSVRSPKGHKPFKDWP